VSIAFFFDQAKCTGCQACILACTIENDLAFDHSWRTVYTFNDRHYPDLTVSHLSLACNHCENPACLTACPANAYSKDAATGFVILDEDLCIGCRYCTWACPYGAPAFDAENGIVAKCTFCMKRQEQRLAPACVEACPTGALDYGDQHNPNPQAPVPGFPATDLGPAIAIAPAAAKQAAPECSTGPSAHPFISNGESAGPGPNIGAEWPLAAFTYLTTLLVALLAASTIGGQPLSLLVFLGIATTAMLLSTAHLGKKLRAWHAVLNPKQSWLSREILFFALLVGAGAGYLTLAPGSRIAGSLAVTIGALTLISIDRVYGTLPLIGPRGLHSARTVLTGVLFAGVLLANPMVAALTGVGKLFLYLQRKVGFKKMGKPTRLGFSSLRILSGFIVPGVVWALSGSDALLFVIVAVSLGELVDRLEFYLELEVVTPGRQMVIDLQKAILVSRPST
jgi:DMSO reductase iron-sulfur subunit